MVSNRFNTEQVWEMVLLDGSDLEDKEIAEEYFDGVAFRTVLDGLLCFFLALNLTSFQYFCQESFFFAFLFCFSTKICPENSRENPAKSAVFSANLSLQIP